MKKKKLKLKPYVLPVFYGIVCAGIIMTIVLLNKTGEEVVLNEYDDYTYVNGSILRKEVPVLKEDDTIIEPFKGEEVKVVKKYYNSKDSEKDKEDEIIFYNDTYMQNTGLIYNSEKEFDVVSVLDGKVIDIKKDDILGNVVEIKHSNNIITVYQGLSVINVKKDAEIKQGDVVGKSGIINLGKDYNNSLLFEVIYDGKLVDPNLYINKKINEI